MVINHLDKLFVTSDAAVIVRELEVGAAQVERLPQILSPKPCSKATGCST